MNDIAEARYGSLRGSLRTLEDIAPAAWEHPADRAALQALRALSIPCGAELDRFIQSGGYARIMGGEYTRRGEEPPLRSMAQDLGEAKDYYVQEAKTVVSDVLGRVTDVFRRK